MQTNIHSVKQTLISSVEQSNRQSLLLKVEKRTKNVPANKQANKQTVKYSNTQTSDKQTESTKQTHIPDDH